MKKKLNLCTRVLTAFALAAAFMLPVPVASADNDSSLDFLEDNGVPVVYLTIDESAEGFGTIREMNESVDHSVRCTGTVRIDVPDGYTGDYSDVVLEDTEELQLEYIRGRSNLTWQAEKKPYKFKLDKKSELLGMPKNKHWALLANSHDGSMIRNRIVSYIGERLGFEYTPKMLPVDLVINGEYAGSYFLSETVRIDKTRLNIDELKAEDNEEPEITGGYLMGLDPFFFFKEFDRSNTTWTTQGMYIWFESPEFYNLDGDETGTMEQMEYIKNYIYDTENAFFSEDFKDSAGNPYTDYMDIRSAADFWWVQEFMINEDAFRSASNYFYKKRDDKLYWGPLWDFDYTMGLLYPDTEGFNHASTPWLDRLRSNEPEYQALLRERWTVLDGIITDIVMEGGLIDRFKAEQANSVNDDFVKWPKPADTPSKRKDFETETELVREWLIKRQAWVNGHIDTDLTDVYTKYIFVVDNMIYATMTFASGSITGEFPVPQDAYDKGFYGWMDNEHSLHCSGEAAPGGVIVLSPLYVNALSPLPPDISEIDSLSDWWEVHEHSEVSEQSEISEISELSDVSERSEISEQSEISESSEQSEISYVSEETDNSETTEEPSEKNSSDPEKPVPDENTPKTGDRTPLSAVLMLTAVLASAVIAAARKKA